MAYDGYRSPHTDPHQASYPNAYDQSFDSRYHSSYNPPGNYPQEPCRPPSRDPSQTRSDGSQQPLNDALRHAFDKSDAARTVDPDLIAEITAQVKKSVLDEIKLTGVGVTSGGQTQPHPSQQQVPHSPTSTSTSIPSRNVYTPPSPKYQDFSSRGSLSPDHLTSSSMFDGSAESSMHRHGNNASTDSYNDRVPPARPAPAQRLSTNGDFTPIEKMWQRLFDQNGTPTPRLGQFLRGLAIHLIQDYDPKGSLVVTPSKMLRFYEEVKLSDENYPWQVIFGKVPNLTLSKIYREMKCQHHLVQESVNDPPDVPGLTPQGFQEWMTAMIQAYPDTEYERLSKAVLDMPISNADDSKERFPKELPRRLFPREENLQAQQRCAAILSAEGVGPLRRAPSFPPPPPMGPHSSVPSGLERERSPYGAQPDAKVFESDDDEPPAVPIERERKPYSAAPGGGKFHDENTNRGTSTNPETDARSRRPRAQSTTAPRHWVPPPNSSHAFNQRGSSHAAHGQRHRSPSLSNYGTRSDPSVADIPPHYSASNIYDTEEDNRRFARDAEIKRADWARRQAEEDNGSAPRRGTGFSDSSYNSPPRPGYEEDYYKSRGNSNGYDAQGYGGRRYG